MLARAVAIHDDDLLRACGLRAAHRGVDLLRVEVTALVVGGVGRGAVNLRPLDDPSDTFHVADDEHLHKGSTESPTATVPGRSTRARTPKSIEPRYRFSSASVSMSRSPVAGSRVVTTHRSTSSTTWTTASPICTRRPNHAS